MGRLLHVSIRALAVVWALPNTLLGLTALAIGVATGGRVSWVRGVLEAHGGWLRRGLARLSIGGGGVAAVTLGHVVLGADERALAETRAHERVHVTQCERWGPLFLPAYAVASLLAFMRGVDPYRDNCFEREAHAVAQLADEAHGRSASRAGDPGTAMTPDRPRPR